MVAITRRADLSRGLTNDEIDANMTNLKTAAEAAALSASWSGVTGKPTTVAGYGITDAQAPLVSGTNIKTVNGQPVLGAGDLALAPASHNHDAAYLGKTAKAADSDLLDGFNSTAFLRAVNGVGPDANGNVTVNVDLSSRIARSGDNMTGTLATKSNTAGSYLNANDNAFSVRGDGSNAAVMSFHRAGAYAINMGLDTDNWFKIGGWSDGQTRFQVRADGHIHTPAYGWLYDFFFSNVANCSAGYGMGNVVVSNCGNVAGARHELVDNGSQLRLQTSQWNYNCNCTCK
jgi:hypothetical protein